MDVKDLQLKANSIRKSIVTMLNAAGSGHPGGAMGIADVLTFLYFSEMRVNPKDPHMSDRDRFVLSAAHMVPGLYATLAEAGFFPKEELTTLRKFGSRLEGHTVRNLDIGVETTGGSLGQGVSIACGMAAAAKVDGASWRTYCIVGDGESNEGSVWEAALFGSKFELDNLVFIIDRNNIQLSGTGQEVMPLDPVADKWRAFNWNVIEIDGNSFDDIAGAFRTAREVKHRPTCIVANTVPGKGVSFMENKAEWHGKTPDDEQTKQALAELDSLNANG
ncbi:MAG: Transketolase 2 [candidate division WS6 bacterium OLB20]|uniref:Transketolase 2 n=1 Tax=candidate division WS6 bacterium OLB20 TaxID=1617426 RepID=A0A136LW52_9BACT|nr:MAG: Transketolase 2 [candidate division WS6 bacterium OLB20]